MQVEVEKSSTPSPLSVWFAELLRGPLQSHGDYFERLSSVVESSAPLCRSCG